MGALSLAFSAGAVGLWVDGFTESWSWIGSVAFRTLLLAVFAALLLDPFLRPSERAELRGRVRPLLGRLRLGAWQAGSVGRIAAHSLRNWTS